MVVYCKGCNKNLDDGTWLHPKLNICSVCNYNLRKSGKKISFKIGLNKWVKTMTTIAVNISKVNGKRPEFDIYVGRAVKDTEFNKDSKWAKPRNISLKKYEPYIITKIKENPKKYDLDELKGNRLGCWCITTDKIYPIVCHIQILMKLIEGNVN